MQRGDTVDKPNNTTLCSLMFLDGRCRKFVHLLLQQGYVRRIVALVHVLRPCRFQHLGQTTDCVTAVGAYDPFFAPPIVPRVSLIVCPYMSSGDPLEMSLIFPGTVAFYSPWWGRPQMSFHEDTVRRVLLVLVLAITLTIVSLSQVKKQWNKQCPGVEGA